MHVLGSEEAYFRFPEKEERLQDLVHMFLPLMSGFVHLFDAVCPGGFYIPGYLHNPSLSRPHLLVLVMNADSLYRPQQNLELSRTNNISSSASSLLHIPRYVYWFK